MNKTKVLFLSTSLNLGGTEKYLVSLIDHFGSKYDFSVLYLKEKGYFGDLLEKKGMCVQKVSAAGLLSAIKRAKPAILQTFLYRANILGRLYGAIARVPIIISTQQAIDKWKSLPYILIDRLTAYFCDIIIANSHFTKKLLIEREGIAKHKIEVIHNGIDPVNYVKSAKTARNEIRLKYNINPESVIVISVARLHSEKGTDLIIEAARITENAVFVIAGDGPQKQLLKDLIIKYGLQDRVLLLGMNKDIAALLNASDIFLLASREESFPQVFLEAMAFKLPIVCSNVGGVKEAVDDTNGILVEPGNIAMFSESLRKLIQNPALRKVLGENGQAKLSGFSETAMFDAIEKVYTRLEKEILCSNS